MVLTETIHGEIWSDPKPDIQVIQKSVTISITCHYHKYWQKRLYFGHVISNIFDFIWQNKNQVQRCKGFLTRGKSQEWCYFGTKTNGSHITTLRRVRHGISWPFQVPPHFQDWETFRYTVHIKHRSANADQHRSRAPKIIDAARESALPGPKVPWPALFYELSNVDTGHSISIWCWTLVDFLLDTR